MQATKGRKPREAVPPSDPVSTDRLRALVAGLLLDATSFVSPARVEETARGWLARAEPGQAVGSRDAALVADALAMATELALFTPSASGATAFERLARQRGSMAVDEAATLAALRRAQFRLLRVDGVSGEGVARLCDLASGEMLDVPDAGIPAGVVGVPIVGRLADFGDGRPMFVGVLTPLDPAGLAVATGFVRSGGRGLTNPLRCAEAIYRHVLRQGTLEIPGLNRPLDGEDVGLPDEEVDELDLLALRWAEPGAAREPDDVQFVRTQADLGTVLDILASAANTRDHGLGALSDAYAAIALVLLETVHRRAAAGSGTVALDTVAAAVQAAAAAGELPPGARAMFDELRQRLGTVSSGSGAKDAELERLIGRIRALRAKTVEQGCTEQEALAAAEKVASLLDRYGLTLSELDLQRQACEGVSVETGRRRVGPVDDCVPAVAAFFDCRTWGEKAASGTLRHVFFGLPADVAAAHYLYALVERAFETETAWFQSGAIYAAARTSARRTATNSFQIGLARGIMAKLQALRQAREAALRGTSGRDLVVAKADVVEAELAKLGLRLRTRSRSGGRRVRQDAFEQGHAAGLGFEYTPGLRHSGG